MATGMEGLGRVFNTIAVANGVAINMALGSAVTWVVTNDDTLTLSTALTFGGTYRAANFFTPTWAPISRYYTNADNGVGTGLWTAVTQTASAVVTTASDIAMAVCLFASQMPTAGGYQYVKATLTNHDGVCYAIVHDLEWAGAPANLQAVSA